MVTNVAIFIARQCDRPVSFPGGENATRPPPWEILLPLRRPPHWETSLGMHHSHGTLQALRLVKSHVISGAMTFVSPYGRTHLQLKEWIATRTVSLHGLGQAWQTGTRVPRCSPSDRTGSQHRFFFFLLLKGGCSQWNSHCFSFIH